jgi:membrane-associated protein
MESSMFLSALSAVKNTTLSVVKNTTNPSGLLAFLQTNGYTIMLILMILEGPIVTYVAAFAASLGVFNIYYILVLSLLGNFIGDLGAFLIGRIGKRYSVEKYVSKLISEKRMEKIKDYLKNHTGKTLAVIKLTPPLPVPGLMLAGASGVSFKKFFIYSSIVSVIYSISMVLLGFYSGFAFNTISKYVKYIEFIIGGSILLAIGIYLLFRYLSKQISIRIERI